MNYELKPENIDWSNEWEKAYARSSIIMRRSNRPAYWDKRAERFSSMDNGALGRVQTLIERIEVDKNTSILDIGCGPGNLAVPLAAHAKSITALDPARGMLEKLEQRAAAEGVCNISTIHKDWEQALRDNDIRPHDIVLSSYSLIMNDIEEALSAMHGYARKTVCIFWFAGRECFGYDNFWPTLFKKEYSAGPDHMMLLNILNSINIYPNVAIIPQQHITTYSSMDDAVQCWTENLCASQEDENNIRKILSEILDTRTESPVLRRNVRSAMIWWDKAS